MAELISPVQAPFELERMVEYSRALVSALPHATVLVVDTEATVWMAEGRLLARHGRDPGALRGKRLDEILPPTKHEMLTERYRGALAGVIQSFDYRTSDGATLCWVQLTPMYHGGDAPAAVIAVIQDVTERDRLSTELESERERRQTAEEMAGLGHWEIDLVSGCVSLSEGSQRLLAAERQPKMAFSCLLNQFDPADRSGIITALGDATDTGVAEYEGDLHALDGTRRRVLMRGTRGVAADGREVITGTTIDITELRAAEQARIESEALFRQGFDGSPIGMAFSHPDTGRYLRINDAFCSMLGRERDELLDLSFHDTTHPEDVTVDEQARQDMVAGRVPHHEVEKRYVRPDGQVFWTSLHVVPVHTEDGRIRGFFSQVVDVTARKEREQQLIREAADLESLEQVRSALADERLVLHAQPIVDLRTGEIVQQELLVRLRREDGELVAPGEFLPAAERYGAIHQIDQWVTQRAVELAAAGYPVEVNLSAASVGDEDMLSTIGEALKRTGADPSLVVFEVTETALMADLDRGRRFAAKLRELGCRFALDDFGTGYGTFTYLKHLPIDYIKIDIEFVRDLLDSGDDERLVRTIVAMARDFGKITIAEGVEDEATLQRLRELGVDHAQGFHIGRPREIVLPAPPAL